LKIFPLLSVWNGFEILVVFGDLSGAMFALAAPISIVTKVRKVTALRAMFSRVRRWW
jgi:hypothetical protein